MAPRAVLMKTGLKSFNTVRHVDIVRSVNIGRPFSTARPFKRTALTKRCFNQRINTSRPFRSTVNTVRVRGFNAVKPSACWVWRPIKPNGALLSNSQLNDKGFVDSGCSRHMTGNIAHLSDFKDFDGGYVTFGGGAYGGRITGKGTIKTDNLDFDDVYFVKELKFNLFSVSQMCDKKNYVLFTDSECLVLSPNFKLPDENQILLKIPRQDNMYSFDMKNIVPKDSLTCLVAKATSEESMLWHRRLGHINFKNINKLVKENLVRDLPLKRFENDQTCVACLKGKQHRASCKTKAFNPITKPLFMLHMDLFGPTFVSSLMHKKYCLVVTDDYSRFSWVFFLTTKDETKKIIKREYSVARTPQQNGVAERRNRTLIEAARTILGKFDGKSDEGFFVGYSLSSKAFRNGPKWLFDIDSLTQSMIYVPVATGTIINEFVDASYFDSLSNDVDNGEPKSATDDQKQVEDGLDNENDAKDKSDDDSSPKEVNAAGQHVNTASPDVNTSSFKLNDVDEPEVDLGNITNSYTVPTTPNTRIHKDHLIENVIGDVKSSVQTRRMTKPTSEQGFLSAVGNEAVHIEMGDIMERASTTTSSLEAEQDSGSGHRCQDTILGDVDAYTKFETTSKQSYDPPLSRGYTLGSGEDRGTDCLPTATIFEELAHIGVAPLFATMMVQPNQEEGVDSGIPTDSHQTPITTQPSTSRSQKQSRRKQRKDTAVTQEEPQQDDSVLDLEKAKDAQAKEIADLKKRVQKLERKKKSRTTWLKRLRKVGMSRRVKSSEDKDSLGDHEDASKQGRSIEDIDKDADVSLVDDTQERSDDAEIFDINELHGDEIVVDIPVG
ncbi:putative ribonuclease H-like domain-containing protein [Tanacetum coccineum]